MSLDKVIRCHYGEFTELVTDPMALASRLNNLTKYDRDEIACHARSCGHHYAIMALSSAIYGKVDWKDLYQALMKENYIDLANILEEEYHKQNPAAQRISYNEIPKIQVSQRPAEYKKEISNSDSAHSSEIPGVNFKNCSGNEGLTNSSSTHAPDVQTIYININGNNNCLQIGGINTMSHNCNASEPNVGENDDTIYEVVCENSGCSDSSEIGIRSSPIPVKKTDGQLDEQCITNDACLTNDLLLRQNNSLKIPEIETIDDNGNETQSKTLIQPEDTSSHCVTTEKTVSISPSSNFDGISSAKELGITLRKNNENDIGKCYFDDDDDTRLKSLMLN